LRQLDAAEEILDDKGKIEREDALTIASLNASLQEESEYRTSLEERIESLDDKNDEIIAKIIKDRDHVFAKYKVIKKEKAEFVVANARLLEDMEKLDKAHKALESTHSLLVKSHEQLQTQLSKSTSPSTSILSRDHANVIEENARLKVELAKATSAKTSIPKGKEKVVAHVFEQKPHKGKEGLGYVAKAKKKKSNNMENKAKPAQTKTPIASGNATRGKTTRSDFAGEANPNYILYVDYYGDVYAKYVGPYDGYIAYSIWVPKTLVANKRGPIEKWVPKTKQ
jgi:chromosome segregation ATPase